MARDRFNREGVPRADLLLALRAPKIVRTAVETDTCLLCCARKVNEAGLCQMCMPLVSDEELRVIERWMTGVGP